MKKLLHILLLIIILPLISSCATTLRKREQKTEIPQYLKEFNLTCIPENHGTCLGPDGKEMIYLGRDSYLNLNVEFPESLPSDLTGSDLIVCIEDIPDMCFTLKPATIKSYATRIALSSIPAGIELSPAVLSVYLNNTLLGKKTMQFSIDTTPPPCPRRVRLTRCETNSFTLTWEAATSDIKEYRIELQKDDEWIPIRSGIKNPPVRIDQPPEGRLRVIAYDCAFNSSISEEIELSEQPQCTKITLTIETLRCYSSGKCEVLQEGNTIYSGDRIKFRFIPNRKCYIYVINIDSHGNAFAIFPNPNINIKNPIKPPDVLLPPSGYFRIDKFTGEEWIYVFVSLKPDKELLSIMQKLKDKRGHLDIEKIINGWSRSRGITIEVNPDLSYNFKTMLETKLNQTISGYKLAFPHADK